MVITHHTIPARRGALRCVQLTDLHLDEQSGPAFLTAVGRAVARRAPDVLVCTGDVFRKEPFGPARAQLAACFAAMPARLGKFAVAGNHDKKVGLTETARFWRDAGFTFLHNDVVQLPGAAVGGLDDALIGRPDGGAMAALKEARGVRIALLHEPLAVGLLPDACADLVLAGHTHGGQLHVPLLEHLWLPAMTGRFVHGMYLTRGMPLYVSAGLGESGPPLRFARPRELAVFDFE